jgi:hypothetical protein
LARYVVVMVASLDTKDGTKDWEVNFEANDLAEVAAKTTSLSTEMLRMVQREVTSAYCPFQLWTKCYDLRKKATMYTASARLRARIQAGQWTPAAKIGG